MRHFIISVAIALGILVPAVAAAQTSTTGLLTVYVQVINQSGYSAFQAMSPSNFTVQVSGNTVSQTSFPGSQSGTPVVLYPGSYNVTVPNAVSGYAPTYSVGCNNTISANQTQTCVITMTPSYSYYPSNNYNYYGNPYYPYYGTPTLSCQAQTPSVPMGQPVTFQAIGGAGGTYNWVAPYTQQLNYPNAGQTLTVTFQTTGQQTVTVTNAAQTASCSVLVTSGFYPTGGYGYPSYPTTPGYSYNPAPGYGYTTPVSGPTYYPSPPTVYPQLPRTGFGPHDLATGMALSAVLLIAFGIIAAPYARKAFAIVSR